MVELPIDRALPEILAQIRQHRALVLVAEPGAGKTTRVAPALVRADLLPADHSNVVMLQPRRVAARAAAERIADENNWTLGQEVGYQIRFERRMTHHTRLRVMTEGILTRQLVDDPFLTGIGCVILDEFHERSLHTDVAAALLREIKTSVRDDLILIVMSATLDAGPVAQFLGGAPVINVPGRTFPVEIEYRTLLAGAVQSPLWKRAADEIKSVAIESDGDILAFLPGVEEIRRTIDLLSGISSQFSVLPLHGSLTIDQQHAALRPAPGGKRKVICATNIAETSLTIDGVRTVIDGGMARIAVYDPRRGLDRLELRRISQASATQRAGRAGRTGPGRCIRLWSERESLAMELFEVPEIRRVDLASTLLTLHAWGEDPHTFGWYESPSTEAMDSAEQLLEMLGALTSDQKRTITPLGRKILALPAHPRLGRLMVDAAAHGLMDSAAAIAAILSEKDFLLSDRAPAKERGRSDVLKRLHLLENSRHHFDVDPQSLRQVQRTRDELKRAAQKMEQSPSSLASTVEDDLLKLVLAAYPDRVCRRRTSDRETAIMVGGTGVKITRESIVQDAEFFVAVDVRADDRSRQRESLVRLASAIEPGWLEELFPQEVRKERRAIYDESKKRVIGLSGFYYRDLTLTEERDAAVDAETAGQVLAAALAPRARSLFETDPHASTILARVALLRTHMPEKEWPAFDDAELRQALVDACDRKRSLDDLTRNNALSNALASRLCWPADRLLEEHAPESLEVPTGNRIKLQYNPSQPPVLAVRLQEIFGWTETPRLAAGRVPIVIHLLGPNYRPVQITSDLKSFWATTYFQVRKDLRAQYPKHSWPENPLTATPVAKGRRRPT